MKKNDLIEAADRALSLLAEMSDDELMLALEQCDASLAYAVNCYAGQTVYSLAETSLRIPSMSVIDRSLYSLLSKELRGSLEPFCLGEAMNDSCYALAA